MYKIYLILVPKRPEIKTKLNIEAKSFKEALEILRKEHNIFEENVYKIELKEKKNIKQEPFDWTISDFYRHNEVNFYLEVVKLYKPYLDSF